MGVILDSLLGKGYFPKELPPTFETASYPSALNIHAPPATFRNRKRVTRMLTHSLARPGKVRRQLGIPNPLTYLLLCEAIETNFNDIDSRLKASPFSTSTPIVNSTSHRAFVPAKLLGDLSELRASTRAIGTVLLRADLSAFYHSIYSHSIPWAIHTKSAAKQNRSEALYGNLIDRCVRNMQDGQTIGIPVGPDASLIIAEIVASAIDLVLQARIPGLQGFRYYDDYEFAFTSLLDANAALAKLEIVVSEFELLLHAGKSGTSDLPQALELEWVATLRSLAIREWGAGQRIDLINFFDQVFQLVVKYPSDHVVSFAIGRVTELIDEIVHWDLVQPLLCQAVLSQPNALPEFFYCLVAAMEETHTIDTDQLEELLNTLIAIHAPLNHGSEVAWSIWGLGAFGLRIRSESAALLGSMEDSVVALLTLDAVQSGLIDAGLDSSVWQSFMQLGDLVGEQWLLSYEANVKGWLPTVGGGDHVATHPDFGYLKVNNVHFYRPITRPVTLAELERWKPSPGDYN